MTPDEYHDGPYRPSNWPDWARDEIITNVNIRFAWTDRVLIAVGRPVTVNVRTLASHPPGRLLTESSAWAHRIRWPWSRRPSTGGYAPTFLEPKPR